MHTLITVFRHFIPTIYTERSDAAVIYSLTTNIGIKNNINSYYYKNNINKLKSTFKKTANPFLKKILYKSISKRAGDVA